MSAGASQKQKIKELKQVVPLQIPRETVDAPVVEVVDNEEKLFKKASADGKTRFTKVAAKETGDLTRKLKLGKRGGLSSQSRLPRLGCDTEPVAGFIEYDASKLTEAESLYVAFVGRFRYGREEDEVLGMSLCREMYMGHKLIHPKGKTLVSSLKEEEQPGPSSGHAPSQQLLHRVSFSFAFPEDAPISTVMQRLTADAGDTCGVRYYIRCYSAFELAEEQSTINVVNFPVRKVQFGPLPDPLPPAPKGSIFKEFPLNGGRLALEATLNKSIYEHGEDIRVKISLINSSHKSVKHVKVTVQQSAQVNLFSTGKWKVCVATTNNRTDCHVGSGHCAEQEVILVPKAGDNKNKYGVFIQGSEFEDEPCLASTTVLSEEAKKDYFGIIIEYEVKVKLCLAALSSLSGFRTWMCNGVKGLVDDKGSPVSSPTKAPSTPAERRGEIACLIPFQIFQKVPTVSLPKTVASLETRVEEITLEE